MGEQGRGEGRGEGKGQGLGVGITAYTPSFLHPPSFLTIWRLNQGPCLCASTQREQTLPLVLN